MLDKSHISQISSHMEPLYYFSQGSLVNKILGFQFGLSYAQRGGVTPL